MEIYKAQEMLEVKFKKCPSGGNLVLPIDEMESDLIIDTIQELYPEYQLSVLDGTSGSTIISYTRL